MGKNNVMPYLCGFVVAIVLLIVVLGTTWGMDLPHVNKIQKIAVLIVFIWGAALLRAEGWKDYTAGVLMTAIVLFISLALFMVSAWNALGTVTPVLGINAVSEGIHRDTLYHNAIASSIAYYGYPSLLVNSGDFHNYHFGSHMFLGFISMLLGIPTFFSYCYLFPMIFFPVYPYLILEVGRRIRIILGKNELITVLDIAVLMCFMMPVILPQQWANEMGNWKTPWLFSESFCMANVLGLLFFTILLGVLIKKKFQKGIVHDAFLLILTLLFIAMVSVSKISVGIVLSIMLAYLLLREKGLTRKYLIISLLFLITPFAIHFVLSLIYSPFLSGTTEGVKFSLLHFIRRYVKYYAYGIHILAFYFLSFMFIFYRLKKITTFEDLRKGIAQKKYVVEEMLIVICVLSSLPGMVIKIGGGSAFYFNSIQQLIATVLLIGYGIPQELYSRFCSFYQSRLRGNCIYKTATVICLICLSLNFIVSTGKYGEKLWKNCWSHKEQNDESVKENSFWSVIDNINKITEGHKGDFYIYVCPSAKVWTKFENPDSALFFYPAMTGIVCIGELYFDKGVLYTNNDVPKTDGYIYRPLVEDAKLTEAGAYQKAKEDGKKAIIYIHDNSMSVVEIES